jgi:hemolysin III
MPARLIWPGNKNGIFVHVFKLWNMTFTSYVFPPRKAEIANSLTHGLGVLFSIAVIFAISFDSSIPDNHRFSLYVFACSMLLMYTVSTVYHATKTIERKRHLRLFDHISIYFLIAGTYTPFILFCLQGAVKWLFFSIVWGIVLFGILYKLFWWGRYPKISLWIYLGMGWIIVFVIKPLLATLSLEGFIWLMIGGFFYSVGTWFYAHKRPFYNHAVWHLFVLAGSASHLMAVLSIR